MWLKVYFIAMILSVIVIDNVVSYNMMPPYSWDNTANNHQSPSQMSSNPRRSTNRHHHNRRQQTPYTNKNEVVYESNELPYTKHDPNDNSQYLVQNFQTGSANIPYPGAKIFISPDHNKTKSYIYKLGSANQPQSLIKSNSISTTRHKSTNNQRRKHPNTTRKYCIKCPQQRTVVAQKNLDGVLIELPKVSTCRNQMISRNLYEIETLFGRNFNFILPQGDHTFLGRIKNKRTGEYEKNCVLRYRVIVRQCSKYYPKNANLKVNCDMGSIWGSKCKFNCSRKDEILSHPEPIVCADGIEWIGEEPECIAPSHSFQQDNPSYPPVPLPLKSASHCELPVPPLNAKFSCEIENNTENNEDNLSVSNGSICRIECNPRYFIPTNMRRFKATQCNNGQWNSTIPSSVCRGI